MREFSNYIGLDVHKDTIAVGIADNDGTEPRFWGTIRHEGEAVRRLVQRLSRRGRRLKFCYEAGPCGYGLYRQLLKLGQAVTVVAPSLIPRSPGERIKTDRRDALSLARLDRRGDLSAVWVPGEDHEAVRDLSRAREDLKIVDKQMRQRLNAFLLRHGKVYEGRQRWTQAHFRWLERQRFASPHQQIVFEEYIEAVRQAQARTASLEQVLREAIQEWSLGETATALTALRGVDQIASMTVLAELGDLTRFSRPPELMSFVGLTPSEASSGSRRRQGGLTKAGNTHVRRMLIECAWGYRFPARKTAVIQRRAEKSSPQVQALAWQAQQRLCGKFRRLAARGKPSTVIVVAIARELLGFMWAITKEVKRQQLLSQAA